LQPGAGINSDFTKYCVDIHQAADVPQNRLAVQRVYTWARPVSATIAKRGEKRSMAVSALDSKTALIVIDLQKGIVSLPLAQPVEKVVENAAQLAEAFRRQGLPVVLVNVTGRAPGRVEQTRNLSQMPADWAELVPELNQQVGDLTVTKRTWGAFLHTDLEQQLRDRGITQVVIVGVSTSMGVESTARQAYELGFNVALAIDAMTDGNGEAHENSTARIFPKLGETGTTQDIIALLDPSADS
jgi:nicotinamidase-related amidase